MIVVYSIPMVLSSLLMAAHLYRNGWVIPAVLCLILPLLLLIQSRWIQWLFTLVMVLYAAEWIRTLLEFIDIYATHGKPTERLTMILGAVTVVTLLSPLVFRTQIMRKRYQKSNTVG
ncbi:MAG: hypothetical protein CSB34_03420 [Desulfobulbus propionicus]|nr:MAG: hypothetical protein CSB34_03420 [Desulfobulbus propionicus]